MSFDWSSLQAAQRARIDAVPDMINHALLVLADLLEDASLACDSPAKTVVETLTEWAVALMSRQWPDDAECWNLTVETDDWYAAATSTS